MAEKKTIYFRLFGSFAYRQSLREKWKQLDGSASCGRKLRSFIEYLIVNHGEDISAADLREKFWPEDKSVNPESSLKYTMHKARGVLNMMFPEYEDDMIWTVRGYFIWNPEIKVRTDIEDFEEKCSEIHNMQRRVEVEELIETLDMYTGEILPGSDMDWMKNLRLHYCALYVDICKAAVMKLEEEGRWETIAEISERAYSLEPDVEEFTVSYMQALTSMGQPQRALEHYELYRKYIWRKYRRIPSQQVEQVYTLAMQSIAAREYRSSEILELLTDGKNDNKAFLCSFNVFKSIVNLEIRHIRREKHISTILMINISGENSKPVTAIELRRMEKTILETLRTGDPVTRLNDGSFAVLLSGATLENVDTVINRIDNVYKKSYPDSNVNIKHQAFAVTEDS